jgi:hypothetical protein
LIPFDFEIEIGRKTAPPKNLETATKAVYLATRNIEAIHVDCQEKKRLQFLLDPWIDYFLTETRPVSTAVMSYWTG